ncbi:aminoglycoside phosphotransferase [Streptomyces sp. NPDC002454]
MTTTPDPGSDAVAEADRRFRLWMRQNLDRAAARFGLTVTGEPVFGWRDRSISAPAHSPDGARWLRVASEQTQWAHGHGWTGNTDANALEGLPKPQILDVYEWDEGDWRRQRAEVMTLAPGTPCSPTDTAPPGLDPPPSAWWTDLRHTLRRLAGTPTDRISTDQEKVDHRVRAAFGENVEVRIERWETVHGDLHWANLLNPLAVLDWELWGRGPAGTDPATLHCYSLTNPALAQQVRGHFPVLDTPDGHRAQLYTTARLLHRARLGDHPHLAHPLNDHARRLLRHLSP